MESVHRNPPTSSDMLNSLILCKTLSDSYRNEKKSYRKRIFSTISFQLCIEYHKRIIYARRFPARCSLFLLCVSALFRYLLSAQHKNSSEKFISKPGNTMRWETRAKWLQRFYIRIALNAIFYAVLLLHRRRCSKSSNWILKLAGCLLSCRFWYCLAFFPTIFSYI